MRVLVTGARGLLGAAILREFRHADLQACGHADLDITQEPAVREAVSRLRPDVIVNCAAYNNVDGAEQDAVAALTLNGFAVLALSRAAREAGATLVHYSSDFVFDGEASRPYVETDPPRPRGVYASSKLLGEWFALEAPGAYVLRVESLFGEPGPEGGRRGSLAMIVDRLRGGEEVPLFVDRSVSPTYTADIARATRLLVERRPPAGLYHCVNSGTATWVEIAAEAACLIGCPLRMKPLTLESAKLAAPRPKYCAMSPAKLASVGIEMPHWKDALARYLGVGTQSR